MNDWLDGPAAFKPHLLGISQIIAQSYFVLRRLIGVQNLFESWIVGLVINLSRKLFIIAGHPFNSQVGEELSSNKSLKI